MVAETALAQLASSGVLGVFLVLTLLALRSKDKDLQDSSKAVQAESKARVDDAQRMLALAMTLQKDVTTAVAALTLIVDKWEKREEERERLNQEIRLRVQTPQEFVVTPPVVRPR